MCAALCAAHARLSHPPWGAGGRREVVRGIVRGTRAPLAPTLRAPRACSRAPRARALARLEPAVANLARASSLHYAGGSGGGGGGGRRSDGWGQARALARMLLRARVVRKRIRALAFAPARSRPPSRLRASALEIPRPGACLYTLCTGRANSPLYTGHVRGSAGVKAGVKADVKAGVKGRLHRPWTWQGSAAGRRARQGSAAERAGGCAGRVHLSVRGTLIKPRLNHQ